MNKKKAKFIMTSIAILGILIIIILYLVLSFDNTDSHYEDGTKWDAILESLDEDTPVEDQLTDDELLELEKYIMGGYDEIPEGSHGGVAGEFNYDPNKKYDFEE